MGRGGAARKQALVTRAASAVCRGWVLHSPGRAWAREAGRRWGARAGSHGARAVGAEARRRGRPRAALAASGGSGRAPAQSSGESSPSVAATAAAAAARPAGPAAPPRDPPAAPHQLRAAAQLRAAGPAASPSQEDFAASSPAYRASPAATCELMELDHRTTGGLHAYPGPRPGRPPSPT